MTDPTQTIRTALTDDLNTIISNHEQRIWSLENTLIAASTPGISPATLTTKGDIIVRSGTGIGRLGVPSPAQDGYVLTVASNAIDGTGLAWAAPSGSTTPLTTKGDIFVRNATVPTRLGVGADGYILTAASGAADGTGLVWAAPPPGAAVDATVAAKGISKLSVAPYTPSSPNVMTGYGGTDSDPNAHVSAYAGSLYTKNAARSNLYVKVFDNEWAGYSGGWRSVMLGQPDGQGFYEYYVAKGGDDSADGKSPGTAFQSLSRALSAISGIGGTIYLGDGIYEPVTITQSGITIRGCGYGATNGSQIRATTGNGITITGSKVSIHNVTVLPPTSGTWDGVGFRLTSGSMNKLVNCMYYGAGAVTVNCNTGGTAIYIDSGEGHYIENFYYTTCKIGIRLGTEATEGNIVSMRGDQAALKAILVDGTPCGGWTWTACKFTHSGGPLVANVPPANYPAWPDQYVVDIGPDYTTNIPGGNHTFINCDFCEGSFNEAGTNNTTYPNKVRIRSFSGNLFEGGGTAPNTTLVVEGRQNIFKNFSVGGDATFIGDVGAYPFGQGGFNEYQSGYVLGILTVTDPTTIIGNVRHESNIVGTFKRLSNNTRSRDDHPYKLGAAHSGASADGYLFMKGQATASPPADSEIATSEVFSWFDHTTNAPQINFKGRDAGGNLFTKTVGDSGSGTVVDATTTIKGKLKLSGFLSGTADSPTVVRVVDDSGDELKAFHGLTGGPVGQWQLSQGSIASPYPTQQPSFAVSRTQNVTTLDPAKGAADQQWQTAILGVSRANSGDVTAVGGLAGAAHQFSTVGAGGIDSTGIWALGVHHGIGGGFGAYIEGRIAEDATSGTPGVGARCRGIEVRTSNYEATPTDSPYVSASITNNKMNALQMSNVVYNNANILGGNGIIFYRPNAALPATQRYGQYDVGIGVTAYGNPIRNAVIRDDGQSVNSILITDFHSGGGIKMNGAYQPGAGGVGIPAIDLTGATFANTYGSAGTGDRGPAIKMNAGSIYISESDFFDRNAQIHLNRNITAPFVGHRVTLHSRHVVKYPGQVADQALGVYSEVVDSTSVANFNVSGATNASPIVLTLPVGHTFVTGDQLAVLNVAGNTAANGIWYISVSGTSVSLYYDAARTNPSIGNGAYTSGGYATNRGKGGAFSCMVYPRLDRTSGLEPLHGSGPNTAYHFDDVCLFGGQNAGPGKAMDAIYIATSPQIINSSAWFTGFNMAADSDYAFTFGGTLPAATFKGEPGAAFDCAGATFATGSAALLTPNNVSAVRARNAGSSAVSFSLLGSNALNEVLVANDGAKTNIGGHTAIKGPRPWIDVTHPTYGADPTGATSSTTALNNAINAATAAGGGTVVVPPGNYVFDKVVGRGIVMKSNVRLLGVGRPIFKPSTTATEAGGSAMTASSGRLLDTYNFTSAGAAMGVYALQNITVEGIVFDGGQWAGSNNGLTGFWTTDTLRLVDCEFRNHLRGHVGIFGCRDVTVRGCKFRDWSSSDYTIGQATDAGTALLFDGNGGAATVSGSTVTASGTTVTAVTGSFVNAKVDQYFQVTVSGTTYARRITVKAADNLSVTVNASYPVAVTNSAWALIDSTPSSGVRCHDLDFQGGSWHAMQPHCRDFVFSNFTIRGAKEAGVYTSAFNADGSEYLPLYSGCQDGMFTNFVVTNVKRQYIASCAFEIAGRNIAVRNFLIHDVEQDAFQINMPGENIAIENGQVYDVLQRKTVTNVTFNSSTTTATYTVPNHGLAATGNKKVAIEGVVSTGPGSYNITTFNFQVTVVDANTFTVNNAVGGNVWNATTANPGTYQSGGTMIYYAWPHYGALTVLQRGWVSSGSLSADAYRTQNNITFRNVQVGRKFTKVADGQITNGSKTLTSATIGFDPSGDTFKKIIVKGAGPTVSGAPTDLVTQIQSVTNATTVTLADAAVNGSNSRTVILGYAPDHKYAVKFDGEAGLTMKNCRVLGGDLRYGYTVSEVGYAPDATVAPGLEIDTSTSVQYPSGKQVNVAGLITGGQGEQQPNVGLATNLRLGTVMNLAGGSPTAPLTTVDEGTVLRISGYYNMDGASTNGQPPLFVIARGAPSTLQQVQGAGFTAHQAGANADACGIISVGRVDGLGAGGGAIGGAFYSQLGIDAKPITGATWLSNVATFTTSGDHGFTAGQTVTVFNVQVTGASGGNYNGTYVIQTTPQTTQFTVSLTAGNPGTYVSGGYAGPAVSSSVTCQAVEATVMNRSGFDFDFLPGENPKTRALLCQTTQVNRVAAAIAIFAVPTSGGFETGIAIPGMGAGFGNPIKGSTLRDCGNAAISIDIQGTHNNAAISVAPGAGRVVFNDGIVGSTITSPTNTLQVVTPVSNDDLSGFGINATKGGTGMELGAFFSVKTTGPILNIKKTSANGSLIAGYLGATPDTNPAILLRNNGLAIGTGGANPIDVALRRIGAATLTIDNDAGGTGHLALAGGGTIYGGSGIVVKQANHPITDADYDPLTVQDGLLGIDEANGVLYFRAAGSWVPIGTGAPSGAPSGPAGGDLDGFYPNPIFDVTAAPQLARLGLGVAATSAVPLTFSVSTAGITGIRGQVAGDVTRRLELRPDSLRFGGGAVAPDCALSYASSELVFGNSGVGITVRWADATQRGAIKAGTVNGLQIGTVGGTTGERLAFWGKTPVTQPGPYTQTYSTATRAVVTPTAQALTDNSGGAADTTLAVIAGGAYGTDAPAIKNNFADLAAQVNKLRADLLVAYQLINSLIDDHQAIGLCE